MTRLMLKSLRKLQEGRKRRMDKENGTLTAFDRESVAKEVEGGGEVAESPSLTVVLLVIRGLLRHEITTAEGILDHRRGVVILHPLETIIALPHHGGRLIHTFRGADETVTTIATTIVTMTAGVHRRPVDGR